MTFLCKRFLARELLIPIDVYLGQYGKYSYSIHTLVHLPVYHVLTVFYVLYTHDVL